MAVLQPSDSTRKSRTGSFSGVGKFSWGQRPKPDPIQGVSCSKTSARPVLEATGVIRARDTDRTSS